MKSPILSTPTGSVVLPPPSAPAIISFAGDPEPEWARIPYIMKRFGWKRTQVFEFIRLNCIKTCCVRKKGNVKGIRLIFVPSVQQFLEILAEEQSLPADTATGSARLSSSSGGEKKA